MLNLCDENFKVTASDLGLITSNAQKYCYLLSEKGYMKLVSMMSNDNDKKWEVMDKIINEYFTMRAIINSNKQLKAQLLLKIYDGGQVGMLAFKQLVDIEVKERIYPLLEIIEEQAPKVEGFYQFLGTSNNLEWDIVAKNLGIGRNTLLKKLRDFGMLQTQVFSHGERMRRGKKHNVPYQPYMKYFELTHVVKNGIRCPKILVTAKGQEYIRKKLISF